MSDINADLEKIKKYADTFGMPYGEDVPLNLEWCLSLADKAYKKGRADAIEKFDKAMIDKINFEEKWLFDCKSNNADTNIAFGGLRSFANSMAEKLKEQSND